jgi:hypothetical protein
MIKIVGPCVSPLPPHLSSGTPGGERVWGCHPLVPRRARSPQNGSPASALLERRHVSPCISGDVQHQGWWSLAKHPAPAGPQMIISYYQLVSDQVVTHVKINDRWCEVHAIEYGQVIGRPEGSDEPVRVLMTTAELASLPEVECRRGERRPGSW